MRRIFRAPFGKLIRLIRPRASSDAVSRDSSPVSCASKRKGKSKDEGNKIPPSSSAPLDIAVQETPLEITVQETSVSSEAKQSDPPCLASHDGPEDAAAAAALRDILDGLYSHDLSPLVQRVLGSHVENDSFSDPMYPYYLDAITPPPVPPTGYVPLPRDQVHNDQPDRPMPNGINGINGTNEIPSHYNTQQLHQEPPRSADSSAVTMDLSAPQRWNIPGLEHYNRTGSHQAGGKWLCQRWTTISVQGYLFRVPVGLLQRYPAWEILDDRRRPPIRAWQINEIHPDVFGIIIECLMTPNGFEGGEAGLNLVIILEAAEQCEAWGMRPEVTKLLRSAHRYIARRIFFRNPFDSRSMVTLDHNYYKYRSEEIYRAWMLLDSSRSYVGQEITAEELALIYIFAIAEDIWPAITADFSSRFNELIDLCIATFRIRLNEEFEKCWFRYFVKAGFLDYSWLRHSPTAMAMFIGHLGLSQNLDEFNEESKEEIRSSVADPSGPSREQPSRGQLSSAQPSRTSRPPIFNAVDFA
ncbi:hypothetical protein VHEMI02357 [[Torrubiella] hemipterigena]|uniref:Uncharacterized protein n=1 Tax=[Torrubiella] hemipterigena TaxID=1531966 RepID=A0A0A1T7Y6_9HYPO|nr:hypothetical protein VHEMI02357 [[Torrubiella] hemipterigena]